MTHDGFTRWFEGLPAGRRAELAEGYAAGLVADGLTVFHADRDRFVPIAPSLSPEVIDEDELARLGDDAEALLSATAKTCAFTLTPAGRAHAELLYSTFTPLEHAALAQDPARLFRVATARVDYFRGPDGVARALELNATIPAMHGYSDLILHRWIRLVAGERGQPAEPLVAQAGSNTVDLLASLTAHYRTAGGLAPRPSIVIVSRRGDSQLGELFHYERAFAAAGHRVRHAYVDELGVAVDGRVTARGEAFDLLYRHIFARKVDPESVLGRLLVTPGPTQILNPVVSPLEVKGVLSLLHAELDTPSLGLSERERDAIRRRVPWTRVLGRGPGITPDGERVDDLARWTAEHPARVVLKRSWDYGGKGVFIGPDAESDAARARMRELYGAEATGWPELVRAAAADPNVWVVQDLVPPSAARHLLVVPGADGRPAAGWHEVFVDVNAYTCLGTDVRPRGGVCRASSSRIVNIAGGGGVAPLVTSRIVDALLPGPILRPGERGELS